MTPAAPIDGSSASRNPLARAFRSCFGRRPPDSSEDVKPSPSPSPSPSDQQQHQTKKTHVLSSSSSSASASSTSRKSMYGSSASSSTSMSSRSMYGSPQWSTKRRSGRGILQVGNTRELIAQAQPGSVRFSMAEIHRATKNFSPTLKIGQGGFGTVYRATLDDGMVVAVKRAKKSVDNSRLGAEFQSEIKMLSRIEHLSLVRFYGYLEYEDEKIIVVEYVPNGTLREHLDCVHGSHLDLAARLDIATDVAHAVTYLHMYNDHPIIHRDIKSSNILLTENFRAKVADFGLARLGATKTGATHVSTQVKGTAGYLDPEYLRTCQLTEKSDVYSFGVLLVELMSGRRPIEPRRERKERITPHWAMKKFMDGDAVLTLDPNLSVSPTTNMALEKILELAFQCLAPTKEGRPSMRKCAEILWSIRKEYRELVSSESLIQSSDRRNHFRQQRGEEPTRKLLTKIVT